MRRALVLVGMVVIVVGCGGRAPRAATSAVTSGCPRAGVGMLQGVIADGSGRKLRGVVVLARAATSSDLRSATTDEYGAYRLCLPAGVYTVQFVAGGAEAASVTGVHVPEARVTPLYEKLGPETHPVPGWYVPNCSDLASAPAASPIGCFP